jgi:hypothetical protein
MAANVLVLSLKLRLQLTLKEEARQIGVLELL